MACTNFPILTMIFFPAVVSRCYHFLTLSFLSHFNPQKRDVWSRLFLQEGAYPHRYTWGFEEHHSASVLYCYVHTFRGEHYTYVVEKLKPAFLRPSANLRSLVTYLSTRFLNVLIHKTHGHRHYRRRLPELAKPAWEIRPLNNYWEIWKLGKEKEKKEAGLAQGWEKKEC